ncbi:MAG: DNA-binding response regulator [Bryobacterales bacterium]|nr:DNA-binding response regulator [Bryobacterales bacterium]
MNRINTLIVDDERLSRQRISRLLGDEPDVDIVAECSNGPEALAAMLEKSPDLMFLDVQMPGVDGFHVMDTAIAKAIPVVVFVTAFDGYALKAFDVQAFDYLLKPFDRARFQETLRRVRLQLSRVRSGEMNQRLAGPADAVRPGQRGCSRIAIRTPGHVAIVRTDEIDWVEAADNYVCIHCGAETHVLRETMNALEARLPNKQFQRVHRSTIVNIDRIKELQPWFRGDYRIILRDGTQLTLTRSYREKLEESLLQAS